MRYRKICKKLQKEFVRGTDDITRIKKSARLKNQQKQTVFYVKNHQSSGYDRGPDLI